MGDMGEMWRDLKIERQLKRRSNQEKSSSVLNEAGIEYTSKNGGNHLVVTANDQIFDFWPSTGKWIARDNGKKGRGVFNLLQRIQEQS